MKSTSEIHRRALAAATAVVGRHRHAIGAAAIGLSLGGGPAGCVIVKVPDDMGYGSESASEATEATGEATSESSTSLISTTALSDATGMSEAGSGSTGEDTLGTGTSGEGTSTSASGTGDTTSDTTGDSTGTESDTGLDDCIDELGEVDWVCCEAQNWEPAEHCTPWGPPAPPRFDVRPRRGRLV